MNLYLMMDAGSLDPLVALYNAVALRSNECDLKKRVMGFFVEKRVFAANRFNIIRFENCTQRLVNMVHHLSVDMR